MKLGKISKHVGLLMLSMMALSSCGGSGGPTQGMEAGHEWVDLGLPSGTKWATCNIGAAAAEETGDYFAWGDTMAKRECVRDNCCTYDKTPSELMEAGILDSTGNLSKEYDAAHNIWGGEWRMPTKAELEELVRNCSPTWTTQNGVDGCLFTGSNGNTIFLPVTGFKDATTIVSAEKFGHYRSSTVYDDEFRSYELSIAQRGRYVDCNYRMIGFAVRPVLKIEK